MYTAYLEGSIRLTEHGVWLHDGEPFQHKRVIDLFNRSIVWDEHDKAYFVQPDERQRARVHVEDTAYFVRQVQDKESPWKIVLLDGSVEELNPETLSRGSEHQLYCKLNNGHRARFTRKAYQQIVEHAESENSIKVQDKVFIINE